MLKDKTKTVTRALDEKMVVVERFMDSAPCFTPLLHRMALLEERLEVVLDLCTKWATPEPEAPPAAGQGPSAAPASASFSSDTASNAADDEESQEEADE